MWPRSLRKRLIVVILICSVVPVVLIGVTSYIVIYSILDNKIAKGIQNNLHQVRIELESAYINLNNISQQMSYTSQIGSNIVNYLKSDKVIDKYILNRQIRESLQIVSFTNPDLGLFYYYVPGSPEVYYPSMNVQTSLDSDKLTLLVNYKGAFFYTPHRASNGHLVLSVVRPIDVLKRTDLYFYIETDSSGSNVLLNREQYGMSGSHILINPSGTIVYSEDQQDFLVGSPLTGPSANENYELINGNYIFQEQSPEQGWRVAISIPEGEFNKEIRSWLLQFWIIVTTSLLISILLGWSIWRMLYSPMKRINRELKLLGNNNFNSSIQLTNIREFDELLMQFKDMREKIFVLLSELKRNEEDKRFLEVEKLVAQMNPHFLYNTLNTVQWLSKAKGNDDVVRLVTILIRLLRYNLGKDGSIVTMKQEIEALNDYVALQQIRYNFEFAITIDIDPDTYLIPVPRFILQPVVENAIYHSQLEEGGKITISILLDHQNGVSVTVIDNGVGMTEEQIEQLLREKVSERDKVGMGIGLHYVNTMLKAYYGEQLQLQIISRPGHGTSISFILPPMIRGDIHD